MNFGEGNALQAVEVEVEVTHLEGVEEVEVLMAFYDDHRMDWEARWTQDRARLVSQLHWEKNPRQTIRHRWRQGRWDLFF